MVEGAYCNIATCNIATSPDLIPLTFPYFRPLSVNLPKLVVCYMLFSYLCIRNFASALMKQIIVCLTLVAGMMMLGACKEKEKSGDIIAPKYVPKTLEEPIKMAEDHQTDNVTWQGNPYTIDIFRMPADSLQKLQDDNGQQYVDNLIDVKIVRKDGSKFFHKSFVKSSFSAHLDEPFKRNGQLVSIRYNEVDNSALEFSVVVGMPDAPDDLFVPLKMTIDRQGAVRVEKDDDMDMLDYDDDDEDDGV